MLLLGVLFGTFYHNSFQGYINGRYYFNTSKKKLLISCQMKNIVHTHVNSSVGSVAY
jgi:hypothetical protein